jgi:hypothetical protein
MVQFCSTHGAGLPPHSLAYLFSRVCLLTNGRVCLLTDGPRARAADANSGSWVSEDGAETCDAVAMTTELEVLELCLAKCTVRTLLPLCLRAARVYCHLFFLCAFFSRAMRTCLRASIRLTDMCLQYAT